MFLKSLVLMVSFFIFSSGSFAQILGSSSSKSGGESKPTASASKKKSTTATKSSSAKPVAKKETSPKKETSAKKESNPTKSPKARETASSKTSSKSKTSNKSNSSVTISKSANSKTAATKQNNNGLSANNDVVIRVGGPSTDELFEQSIELGNVSRDERNYQKAESSYRQAAKLKPRDSRWIYGLGNLFSDQQRWEEAENAYNQAIVLEPNTPEAYIALSFVLTQPISGANLGDRYSEAEKMARKALTLDADNTIAYDQLGVSLELQGIIVGETLEAYKKAIQLDSSYALAYAHLGRLYRRNGMTNEAATAYRQANQLATDVPTMILVAEVFQSQQKFTESEQLLRRALASDSKNPTALYLLGRALTTRGSFDEAERVLRKSIEVSPNSFVPYTILSSVYLRRGKFEDSEKSLMDALKVSSATEKKQLAQDFAKLGDGYLAAQKGKEAVRVYRQALLIDNRNQQILSKLANAQKLGN
jgi:cytochrome c-type biogenesis protein CcmH/NrfG